MKLLFLILLAGVGAYFFPQFYEEAEGPCQALETKAIRVNSATSLVGNLALSISDGSVGRQIASEHYPDLPRYIGCVITYYDFPENLRL